MDLSVLDMDLGIWVGKLASLLVGFLRDWFVKWSGVMWLSGMLELLMLGNFYVTLAHG